MPVSRKRKKEVYKPPPSPTSTRRRRPSPIWLAPLMLTLFGIGILWLVVFYLSNGGMGGLPYAEDWNNWNLVVGFGFIVVGFALSTQWR
ncbi:MAG TPA: cell division protein CrgA [Mycobacteriales bacterium]|nr:cell division protein CrgA [Mycobacteriales bacterium]